MALTEKYTPAEAELRIARQWQAQGVYDFDRNSQKPVYSINTPPATVSGHLHLGHIYSYVQTDFIARFWRMNGCNVFYPMGYDDNGLPTDRLVQRVKKVTPEQIGRNAFKQACLEFSQEAEVEYQTLWQRLGLSVDWSYTYRTVNDLAKQRLYSESVVQGESARFCMAVLLRDLLKLLAPFFPYITEELYQGLFPALSAGQSIHLSAWPNADARLVSPEAGSTGETLVSIATAMRRFKSENNLPLGSRLDRVQLACDLPGLAEAIPDLMSVTRADKIELVDRLDDSLVLLNGDGPVKSALRI